VDVTGRIRQLDIVRGTAVLGILLMNIWAFAGPQAIFDYPSAAAGWPGAVVPTWAVVHTLFEGSQRALFSLLFGAGMLLMVSRLTRDGRSAAAFYYRRLGLLMAFGLFDAFVLLWPADILLTYAVCGLLLYPLRRLSAATLLLLAFCVAAGNAALRHADLVEARQLARAYPLAVQRRGEDPEAARQAEAWEAIEQRARPDLESATLRSSIQRIGQGSLRELYAERGRSSLVLQTVVAANAWFLDSLAMMLAGMALLRAGLLAGAVKRSRLLWLAVIGYGIGLPLSATETASLLAADFDPLLRKTWLLAYDLRRGAMAAGHLGLLLLFARSGWLRRLQDALATTGRMALSNYLGQSLLGALIFYSVGLGLYGRLSGAWLYLPLLCIWTLQLTASRWWLARYRQGPAEWLWRCLTYRQRLPLAKKEPGARPGS